MSFVTIFVFLFKTIVFLTTNLISSITAIGNIIVSLYFFTFLSLFFSYSRGGWSMTMER